MKFDEINKKNQDVIKKELERFLQTIDYSKVEVEIKGEDKIVVRYGDSLFEIPVVKPDQTTANALWHVLLSGLLIIGGVAVALALGKGGSIPEADE